MKKIRLHIKDEIKFVLLGHGYSLCYMAKSLLKMGFKKPLIITHPKELHSRDKALLPSSKTLYEDVFEFAKKYAIDLIETSSVNDNSIIDLR